MKINLHILLLGILLVSALYSCNNEDDLDISEKKDNRFDLPQGDHDFDDQIVEWNNNYGTSVLYRFSNADLNYHFTSSSNDVVYDVKVEAEEEGTIPRKDSYGRNAIPKQQLCAVMGHDQSRRYGL